MVGDEKEDVDAKLGVVYMKDAFEGGGKKESLEAGMRLMATDDSAELNACPVSSKDPSTFFTPF